MRDWRQAPAFYETAMWEVGWHSTRPATPSTHKSRQSSDVDTTSVHPPRQKRRTLADDRDNRRMKDHGIELKHRMAVQKYCNTCVWCQSWWREGGRCSICCFVAKSNNQRSVSQQCAIFICRRRWYFNITTTLSWENTTCMQNVIGQEPTHRRTLM